MINILVDIVSKGGNLLLNIAPSPEGTWDEEAYTRLKEFGAWMKINDEAIYNTRPLAPYREGKICFTQLKDRTAYAIYLADGNEKNIPHEIKLPCSVVGSKTKVSLLGSKEKLELNKSGNDFVVKISKTLQNNPPCEHAWVLKISN